MVILVFQTFLYVEINAVSLAILLLISMNLSHRIDRYSLDQRLFQALIFSDAIILVLDTGMWLLDGTPGTFFRIVYLLVTACYYVLNPIICVIWCYCAEYQIFRSMNRFRHRHIPMFIPAGINRILSFLSIFNGWFFYLDADNV